MSKLLEELSYSIIDWARLVLCVPEFHLGKPSSKYPSWGTSFVTWNETEMSVSAPTTSDVPTFAIEDVMGPGVVLKLKLLDPDASRRLSEAS